MNQVTKQILLTATGAAVAATVTALVTHYLTKEATIRDVASGATPLPAGATPSTSKVMSGPGGTTPGGTSPAPNLPTTPAPVAQAATPQQAMSLLNALMGPSWSNAPPLNQ